MKSLCVFFVLAISSSLAMNLRPKRQLEDSNSNELEDRYLGRPQQGRQWNQFQFPGQNQFPGQGQFPGQNQFPGQGQFPGQNQFPGQGQFPGQNQFPGQGQFPGQNQFPGQGQFPGQQQQQSSTAAPNNNGVQDCMRSCPVTSEYNPVCGTDGTTYTNPGRLTCARACGVNVNLQRSAPCPTTTVAPS